MTNEKKKGRNDENDERTGSARAPFFYYLSALVVLLTHSSCSYGAVLEIRRLRHLRRELRPAVHAATNCPLGSQGLTGVFNPRFRSTKRSPLFLRNRSSNKSAGEETSMLACSCKDVSFGGIRELDIAAADADPYPAGSLGARLDALAAMTGGPMRKILSTQIGPASGFAWDASATTISFIRHDDDVAVTTRPSPQHMRYRLRFTNNLLLLRRPCTNKWPAAMEQCLLRSAARLGDFWTGRQMRASPRLRYRLRH